MSKEAINQYLTEAMGECHHKWDMVEDCPPFRRYICQSCDEKAINPPPNIDLYSNEGYGKLRDFYDGWKEDKKDRFVEWHMSRFIGVKRPIYTRKFLLHAFHRDNLAPLIYEFLQGKG